MARFSTPKRYPNPRGCEMVPIGYVDKISEEFEWRIPNFFSLLKEYNKHKNSHNFSFAQEFWYLSIFSNSSGTDKESVGCIHFGLSRYCSGPAISLDYSISLKTSKGEKVKEKHFQNTFTTARVYAGIYKHITTEELASREAELLPSNVLTVLCTIKYPKFIGKYIIHNEMEEKTITFNISLLNKQNFVTYQGGVSNLECSYCKEKFSVSDFVHHRMKCANKPIKCLDCGRIVVLHKWYEHECETGTIETAQCSYCKKSLNSEAISVHEKCMNKPIKCPECCDTVLLWNWYEHECQTRKQKDDGSFVSLSKDYKNIFMDGRNHDLIFKIGEKEIRAHQDILRARSKVFESMLYYDMKEKTSGVIDVPDCDPETMEMFLSYVYSGDVELHESKMLALYYIADKYDMQGLKKHCCDFIKTSLSFTNICEVIKFALKHGDTGLLEYTKEYFMHNALSIMHTEEWQIFLKDNTTVGNEFLIKSFIKLKK